MCIFCLALCPLLVTKRCQLSGPARGSRSPPPLTNDSGLLGSDTATSWGNLYCDQNTGQKPPVKSHNKVKQRNHGLHWRGESPLKCHLYLGILLSMITLSYFSYKRTILYLNKEQGIYFFLLVLLLSHFKLSED